MSPTSATSRLASISVEPNKATDRLKVLDAIRASGERGLTDQEIQDRLGMDPNTERPRRVELRDEFKLIVDSGRTRPTRSGRGAVVWVVREVNDGPLRQTDLF